MSQRIPLLIVVAIIAAPLYAHGADSDRGSVSSEVAVDHSETSEESRSDVRTAPGERNDVVDAAGNEAEYPPGNSVTFDPLTFVVPPILSVVPGVTVLPGVTAGYEFQLPGAFSVRTHASWLHMRFSDATSTGTANFFGAGAQPRWYVRGNGRRAFFVGWDVTGTIGSMRGQLPVVLETGAAPSTNFLPTLRLGPTIGAKKVWDSGFTLEGDVGVTAALSERPPTEDQFALGNWTFTERYTVRIGWTF